MYYSPYIQKRQTESQLIDRNIWWCPLCRIQHNNDSKKEYYKHILDHYTSTEVKCDDTTFAVFKSSKSYKFFHCVQAIEIVKV